MNSRYLEPRVTDFWREMRAFRELVRIFSELAPAVEKKEAAALKELSARRYKYREILNCALWLLDNGIPGDRQRCIFPISWLAAGDRIPKIQAQVLREEIRAAREAKMRELLAQREREFQRAERESTRATAIFRREYPSEAEQRRAIIRIFNLNRDFFGPLELADPAAQSIALALAVQEIESLSRLSQDASIGVRRMVVKA